MDQTWFWAIGTIAKIRDSTTVKHAWTRLLGYICCAQRDYQALRARQEYGRALQLRFPHKSWLSNTKVSVCYYLSGVILHRLTNSPKKKKLAHTIQYVVDAFIVTPENGSTYR